MLEQEPKIQYSDVASRQTLEAAPAEVPIVDFTASKLEIMYPDPPEGLGFSAGEIGEILGIKKGSVYVALRREKIPSKLSVTNPDLLQRRTAGVRRAYDEHHDDIIARVHTPDSLARRTDAVKESWVGDTARIEHHRDQTSKLHLRLVEKQKQNKEERLRQVREARIRSARQILDHEKFAELPPRIQEILRKRYRTDGQRPLSYPKVSEAMKFSATWVKELGERGLEILGMMAHKKVDGY